MLFTPATMRHFRLDFHRAMQHADIRVLRSLRNTFDVQAFESLQIGDHSARHWMANSPNKDIRALAAALKYPRITPGLGFGYGNHKLEVRNDIGAARHRP